MKGFHNFLKKIKNPNVKIAIYAFVDIFANDIFAPALLGITFIGITFIYLGFKEYVALQNIFPTPKIAFTPSLLPYLSSQESPNITAQAALVMDNTSKVIVYSKNQNLRFSPASTTKVMTALTGLQYFHLNDVLTIKTFPVEGSIVGFTLGQKLTFKDFLYGMLLPSGNDAALAIAQNYPGGENAFVAKMNENAKKWHLYNTHYGDPAGLTDDDTYTTVVDLARLASIAIQNPVFADVVKTKYATLITSDKTVYPVKNLNILLGEYGVNGIKTGYTQEAEQVLVTSVNHNKHTWITVVMRSQDRFADTVELITSIIDNANYLSIRL